MRDMKNIPNWDVFMSTAMAEKHTQFSDELYCMIFDYEDFEKDIRNNWSDLDYFLSDIMYNEVESSIDFLLNLFKVVITEHKVEKYKNEELRDIRLEFHNERLTQFIGWAKFHFEMMVQEINNKSKPLITDGLLFKDLFISGSDYNKVIELMIAKERFLESSGKLIFFPFRKGCKYEIEAFRQALSFKQVLKPIQPTTKELLSIYLNSFNIKTTDKTLRSLEIPDSVKKYLSILTDIS